MRSWDLGSHPVSHVGNRGPGTSHYHCLPGSVCVGTLRQASKVRFQSRHSYMEQKHLNCSTRHPPLFILFILLKMLIFLCTLWSFSLVIPHSNSLLNIPFLWLAHSCILQASCFYGIYLECFPYLTLASHLQSLRRILWSDCQGFNKLFHLSHILPKPLVRKSFILICGVLEICSSVSCGLF